LSKYHAIENRQTGLRLLRKTLVCGAKDMITEFIVRLERQKYNYLK